MEQIKFIDTHSHIYTEEFDPDRKEMIERALRAGVGKIIIPATGVDTIKRVRTLTEEYPNICVPAIGLHPTDIKEDFQSELLAIEKEARSGYYKGIGETGIDLHWDKTFTKNQVTSFIRHIELASELKLPLIVHARDAFEITLETVRAHQSNGLKGIFHCFSGTIQEAEAIINEGFFLGIGGSITFKNSTMPQVLKTIGLSHVVLETDAPYLAPVPFRGKRNESSYIPLIAGHISQIFDLSIDEVAGITTANALSLFDLSSFFV